jgi:hypothetical protein
MAPEQFNPTEETDYAMVDVYAVGTTLFNMLTGDCPFKGDNPFALRDAKLFSDPPPPSDLAKGVSKELDRIVGKSLARDPENRYRSASEMQRALESLQPAGGTAIRPTSPSFAVGAPTPPPGRPQKSRRPLILGIAGVVAVAVLAVVGYTLFGSGGDEGGEPPPGDTTVVDGGGTVSEAKGIIALTVTPRGDIYIDDSLVERMASSAFFVGDTGTHAIRVENSEARPSRHSDTVIVSKDQTVTWSHTFTIKPPDQTQQVVNDKPPAQTTVSVRVGSDPHQAEIFVDGKSTGRLTNTIIPLEPGRHTITLKKLIDGSVVSKDTTFMVEADGDHRVKLYLTK